LGCNSGKKKLKKKDQEAFGIHIKE